ncbi:MAG: hypothetical protein ACXQTS_02880 [Candidatus Methanospirareceae archaeon]
MSIVEEWLKRERGRDLREEEKKILEELVEDAKFAVYCQTSGGRCMSDFGRKVAAFASLLGVPADILFRKVVDSAVEALKEGFDF